MLRRTLLRTAVALLALTAAAKGTASAQPQQYWLVELGCTMTCVGGTGLSGCDSPAACGMWFSGCMVGCLYG